MYTKQRKNITINKYQLRSNKSISKKRKKRIGLVNI
jgi:hypothetical protein